MENKDFKNQNEVEISQTQATVIKSEILTPKQMKKKLAREARLKAPKTARAGVVLSRITLLVFLVGVLFLVMGFGSVFLMVGLLLITLLTLFTVLASKEFMSLFSNSGELVTKLAPFLAVAPFMFAGSFLMAVISLLLLGKEREWNKAKKARIRNIVLMVLSMLGAILFFTV